MRLHLSAKVERLIEEKVESGDYQSPDEVVSEALHALDERDQELGKRALAFKAKMEARLSSGPPTLLDFSAVKKSIREELELRKGRDR